MRYFIIFFAGRSESRSFSGNDTLECETYPNRAKYLELLKTNLAERNIKAESVVITNIVELTKEDMQSYIAKEID